MHTDFTLDIFDNITAQIGSEFRAFTYKTCPEFDTQELKRECEARKRRQLKKTSKSTAKENSTAEIQANKDGQQPKKFNLQTYKYHSLGDYAQTIRRFGTTDSYSTEPVSLNFLLSALNYVDA